MFALGRGAALVASALFNIGLALQAIEARAAPASLSLRLSLLLRLLRRPTWLVGWLLGVAGIGPQVLALATAPFVVVQPALAVGLLLLGRGRWGSAAVWAVVGLAASRRHSPA